MKYALLLTLLLTSTFAHAEIRRDARPEVLEAFSYIYAGTCVDMTQEDCFKQQRDIFIQDVVQSYRATKAREALVVSRVKVVDLPATSKITWDDIS